MIERQHTCYMKGSIPAMRIIKGSIPAMRIIKGSIPAMRIMVFMPW
jgi:hypothetical protein